MTNPLLPLGWITLLLMLFAVAVYRRPRDERTKLRNQVKSGVAFGIYSTVQAFWHPWIRSADQLKWPMLILSATAACVFFHIAWTKYWEHREKYPHDALFKRE